MNVIATSSAARIKNLYPEAGMTAFICFTILTPEDFTGDFFLKLSTDISI